MGSEMCIRDRLLSELTDEKGNRVSIGSVASGGRYDDLVKRFKGVEVPAVGISVGVSRLLSALALANKQSAASMGPVVVLALDKDQMGAYQLMAREIRAAGIPVEVYLGGSGMRAQMKYADKRGACVAVIEGEDERKAGVLTLKDLVLGAKLSGEIEDNEAWRKDQPAQIEIQRADLVASVKSMLARHS